MITPIKDPRKEYADRIEQNRPGLVSLAYALVGNHYDAEDVVQDGAIRALRRAHQLRDELSFDAWVGRIVINTGHDFHRRNNAEARRPSNGGIIPLDDPDYKGLHESTDERIPYLALVISYNSLTAVIYHELDNIDPLCREAFVLNVFEDMNFREIGELLGIKQNTAYTRAERAKMQLAGRLVKHGYRA